MEHPKSAPKEVIPSRPRVAAEPRRAPPDIKQIRRELGWDLLKMERAPYRR